MGDTRTTTGPDNQDPAETVDDSDRTTEADMAEPGVTESANRDHGGGPGDLPQD